jgi:hypothetical protein
MRNCLLVIAVFVSAYPLYGFQTGNASHVARSKTDKPASPAQAPNQTQDQKVTVVSVPEIKVDQVKDSLDKRMVNYTRILMIVGVVGTLIALGTLFLIKKEVGAAVTALTHSDKIATAATNAANALMVSDRAWILIKKTITQDRIQDPYLPSAEEMMAPGRQPNCIFYLKNYGKTPGRMVAWRYELQLGPSPDVPPDVTVYATNNLPNATPDLIPQGTSVAQEARFRTWPTLGTQEFAEIATGNMFLWLCGIIRYEDTFERGTESLHETRSCYLWETRMNTPTPAWMPAGPAQYTRAT